MYWRIHGFPELQHLGDAERDQLLRSHLRRGLEIRLALSSLLRGLCLSFLLGFAILALSSGFKGSGRSIAYLLIYPLLWAVFSVGFYQFNLIRIRGQLRIYLIEQRQQGVRVPVCVKCGYAVHQGQRACPECGEPTD